MSDSHNAGSPTVGHEERDVNVGAILGYGLGLAVVAAIAHLFLWWLLGTYTRQAQEAQVHRFPLAVTREQLPSGPRLQSRPQQEMRELRARQQALLQGYAWVDRDGGVARIPIEDAMRIVVERGLPVSEAVK